MARTVRGCLQCSLKFVNSVIAILGLTMIFYGVWMIRVWGRDVYNSGGDLDLNFHLPWFIHAFLGIGIALCALACLGHFAADTGNTCCLGCYSAIIFVLILLDTAMIADVLLNSNWEKDLPDDPTGRFDDFKKFVEDNIYVCQWVALLIFLSQGCSILIATIIRTLAEDEKYYYSYGYGSSFYGDIEEQDHAVENNAPRLPLLHPPPPTSHAFPSYVVGEPQLFYNFSDDWKSVGI